MQHHAAVKPLLVKLLLCLWCTSAHGAQAAGNPPEPLVFEFVQAGCAPCNRAIPVVRAAQRAGYDIRVVDALAAEYADLVNRFNPRSTPTFIAVDSAQSLVEIKRLAGPVTAAQLHTFLNNAGVRPQPRP